jgi:hypothetical protein
MSISNLRFALAPVQVPVIPCGVEVNEGVPPSRGETFSGFNNEPASAANSGSASTVKRTEIANVDRIRARSQTIFVV